MWNIDIFMQHMNQLVSDYLLLYSWFSLYLLLLFLYVQVSVRILDFIFSCLLQTVTILSLYFSSGHGTMYLC